MPYRLSKDGKTVINAQTNTPVNGGKHQTKQQALAHLRALEANVSEAHKTMYTVKQTEYGYKIYLGTKDCGFDAHPTVASAKAQCDSLNAQLKKGSKFSFGELADDQMKAITTNNATSVGFGVSEGNVSDIPESPSKYKVGDDVYIKAYSSEGRVVKTVRQKNGGVLYTIRASDGVYYATAQDLARKSMAIKDITKREWLEKYFTFRGQPLATEFNRLKNEPSYIPNGRVSQTWELFIKMLRRAERNELIPYASTDKLANKTQKVYALDRALREGNHPQARQELIKTISEALQYFIALHDKAVSLPKRLLESVVGERIFKSAKSQPLTTLTLADILYQLREAVQDKLDSGEPVTIRQVTITKPDEIRIVSNDVQVKQGKGEWLSLRPDEIATLSQWCYTPSPVDHENAVNVAVRNGAKVPSEVLADYPELSQHVNAQKAINPIREAFIGVATIGKQFDDNGTVNEDAIRGVQASIQKARAFMNPLANQHADEALRMLEGALSQEGEQVKGLIEGAKNHIKQAFTAQRATKQETPTTKASTSTLTARNDLSVKIEPMSTGSITVGTLPQWMTENKLPETPIVAKTETLETE